MSNFFGRNVDYTGCEILVKLGTKHPDILDRHREHYWRDGQIVQIRPLGYHTGKYIGHCRALIQFPNISYTQIGGKTEEHWKESNPSIIDKYQRKKDDYNLYPWENDIDDNIKTDVKGRRKRDYLIDIQNLVNENYITLEERENLYDFGIKSNPIIIYDSNFDNVIKFEDDWERLDDWSDRKHASITNGTYSIGSDLDYDDITDFEAAIGAQMDGNLTGEHNNEETVISSAVLFDTDTNGSLLKLTAASGAEHNGAAYGNGARINYGAFDSIVFDETNDGDLADIEISKLALNMDGSGNDGVRLDDVGGNALINRMLVKGGAGSSSGIEVLALSGLNAIVKNNIVYDVGDGSGDGGFRFFSAFNSSVITMYNNTIISCYEGIIQESSSGNDTLTFKNNLVQDSGNADFRDDGEGFGTTAKNISEDATSPDASYRSKDLHTNSVFVNYASDNYKIDKDGDSTNLAIIDDGEDLSAIFTDDINHDSGRRP